MKRLLLIGLAASGCYRDLDIAICQKNPSDPVCFADAAEDSTTDATSETSVGDANVDSAADTSVAVDSSSADTSSNDSSETSADTAAADAVDAAGSCTDSGAATEACGKCGTRSRTCIAENTWSAWGACGGEGVCTPGEVADVTGGTACSGVLEKKTKTCTTSCTWGADVCALPKGWTAIASVPAGFEGRVYDANAWTGGELFTFGGGIKTDGTEAGRIDGALYRPKLNTWEVLPSFPLAGRHHHGGVWAAGRFLVWGGQDGSTVLGDGAGYDPVLKEWSALPAATISARHSFASVWIPTIQKWFIWGGMNSAGAELADGALFSETSGWTTLPAAPISGRRFALATWTGTEVLLYSGQSGTAVVDDGALFNPATSSWRTIPPSGLTPRVWSAFASNATSMVYVGVFNETGYSNDGERILIASLARSPLPNAGSLAVRRYSPVSWFDGQRLTIWSGMTTSGSDSIFRTDAVVYDLAANDWSSFDAPNPPLPRIRASAAWAGSFAIVWSGLGQPGGGIIENLGSAAIYVP